MNPTTARIDSSRRQGGTDGADFLPVTMEEMRAFFDPYVIEDLTGSPRWEEIVAPIRRRIVKDAAKRLLLGWRSQEFTRTESQVAERYSDKWVQRTAATKPTGSELPVVWSGRRLLVNSLGMRMLYVLRLMRLIEQLKPRAVLDIGCGTGEKLFLLAARFPDVKFLGVELTQGGISAARDVQAMPTLPVDLASVSPEPIQDMTAHRRIEFHQASAKNLPFAADSIDLVYTSLAIEQMQSIKTEVIAEIARVCRGHASFFEAFRDFNKTGLARIYNYAENYFRGELKELTAAGFAKVEAFSGLPQKIWMNNVHVLATKAGE